MIGGESREIRGKEIEGTEERKSAYLCLVTENHRLEMISGRTTRGRSSSFAVDRREVRLLLGADEEMTRRLQKG